MVSAAFTTFWGVASNRESAGQESDFILEFSSPRLFAQTISTGVGVIEWQHRNIQSEPMTSEPMPRLVLKANQFDAEAVVAERRFAGVLPHGSTAPSRIVVLKPSPVLQRSHRRVPRPPLLLDVLVTGYWCGGSKGAKPVGEKLAIFSEAGADTQTELMIPPRPPYDKRRGSGRFRFGLRLWNVQRRAEDSR